LAFAFSSTPFEVAGAVFLPLVVVFRVGGLVVLGLLLPLLGIRSSWARNAVDRMQVGRMCLILYAAFVLFMGGASVAIDVGDGQWMVGASRTHAYQLGLPEVQLDLSSTLASNGGVGDH